MGIDAGASATKIVGFSGDKLIGTLKVEAGDRETALYGAIGKFLHLYNIKLDDICDIYMTGTGASFFEHDVYDIPTHKVSEFRAIGRGGLKVSGLKEAIVVSVGTGTAVVRADADGEKHLGGSGIGGGTLLGLSRLLINEEDACRISSLAAKGRLENVDLLMKDITNQATTALPSHATASNFGSLSKSATREDLAAGITSLVIQTVGMISVFACVNDSIGDVVLTGATSTLPQCAKIMHEISEMTGVRFHIPENAAFATAIGAMLC